MGSSLGMATLAGVVMPDRAFELFFWAVVVVGGAVAVGWLL